MSTGAPTGAPTRSPSVAPSNETIVPTPGPTVYVSPFEEILDSNWAPIVAFFCATCAVLISGYNIARHLTHYNEPALQKSIIRILLMVPIYAVFSYLSLVIQAGRIYFDSFKAVYEALVVYYFLSLILAYCGGENACLSVIMQQPGSVTHVFPLNCCFGSIPLTARFLRLCKQGTLQFVIVKPVMAILNLIIRDAPGWETVEAVVYNTSYTLALYALMMFYKATHEHPGLTGAQPILKFLSVKLVVFATYYQSVLIAVLPGQKAGVMESFNDWLLCIEMVPFALVQLFAFSITEFKNKSGKNIASRYDSSFESSVAHGGFQAEMSSSVGGRSENTMVNNAKEVINMRDVAQDAYFNFNNKYGDHVMLDSRASEGHTVIDLDSDGDGIGENSISDSTSPSPPKSSGLVASFFGSRGNKESDSEDMTNPFAVVVPPSSGSPRAASSSSGSPRARHDNLSASFSSQTAAPASRSQENPFAAEVADPLNISQRASGRLNSADSVSSFDLNFAQPKSAPAPAPGGPPSGDQDIWTVDFDEDFEEPAKAKKSKGKKGKSSAEVGLA